MSPESVVFRRIEDRVRIIAPLLDACLGHVIASPDCPALFAVGCATCGASLEIPTSGPIPPATGPCPECPQLIAAAAAWRRERLEPCW